MIQKHNPSVPAGYVFSFFIRKLLEKALICAIIKLNRKHTCTDTIQEETIMQFDLIEIVKWLFNMLSGIFQRTDDGILEFVFSKGAELLDENKDKINDGKPINVKI